MKKRLLFPKCKFEGQTHYWVSDKDAYYEGNLGGWRHECRLWGDSHTGCVTLCRSYTPAHYGVDGLMEEGITRCRDCYTVLSWGG